MKHRRQHAPEATGETGMDDQLGWYFMEKCTLCGAIRRNFSRGELEILESWKLRGKVVPFHVCKGKDK